MESATCSRKPIETAEEAVKAIAWARRAAREHSLHGVAYELEFVETYLTRPTADLGEDGELERELRELAYSWRMIEQPAIASLMEQAADRLILYREALVAFDACELEAMKPTEYIVLRVPFSVMRKRDEALGRDSDTRPKDGDAKQGSTRE